MRLRRCLVVTLLAASVLACGGGAVACPDGTEEASSVSLPNNVETVVGDVEVGVANTASVRSGLSTTEQSTLLLGPDDELRVTDGTTVELAGVEWVADVRTGDDPGVELLECR